MFCHELNHSAVPPVLAGSVLSKFVCFPSVVSPGIEFFYMKRVSSYLLFRLFRSTVAEAGKQVKEQRHSACTIAKWLAVVGPDEI